MIEYDNIKENGSDLSTRLVDDKKSETEIIQGKPFIISGFFNSNNKYIINKIVVDNTELKNVDITEETDNLTPVKDQIANILTQTTVGGRRKTNKRKYKNNKRK